MDNRKNNELIAKFMGGKFTIIRSHTPNVTFDTHPNRSRNHASNSMHPKYLKYDKSWDWLMPVVEKIENMNITIDEVETSVDVAVCYGDCTIKDEDGRGLVDIYEHSTDSQDKIGATYRAVTKFIEWFNENQ